MVVFSERETKNIQQLLKIVVDFVRELELITFPTFEMQVWLSMYLYFQLLANNYDLINFW